MSSASIFDTGLAIEGCLGILCSGMLIAGDGGRGDVVKNYSKRRGELRKMSGTGVSVLLIKD
jgi:hypothetical protein